MLVAGLIVESFAACLMGFVPRERGTVSVFILLRILQGIGAAGSYTALLAYVAERFPQHLGMIMGLQEAVAGAQRPPNDLLRLVDDPSCLFDASRSICNIRLRASQASQQPALDARFCCVLGCTL